jgi:hypothetical protein
MRISDHEAITNGLCFSEAGDQARRALDMTESTGEQVPPINSVWGKVVAMTGLISASTALLALFIHNHIHH